MDYATFEPILRPRSSTGYQAPSLQPNRCSTTPVVTQGPMLSIELIERDEPCGLLRAYAPLDPERCRAGVRDILFCFCETRKPSSGISNKKMAQMKRRLKCCCAFGPLTYRCVCLRPQLTELPCSGSPGRIDVRGRTEHGSAVTPSVSSLELRVFTRSVVS